MVNKRLDQVLSYLFPDYSRSRLQQWVRQGYVLVNGKAKRPRDKVNAGEHIIITVLVEEPQGKKAQPIDLDIIYEDEAIIVVNKPVGLVVHPAAGNPDGTLLNALLHHDASLEQVPRAGIIHRLDKETSGLLVIARTLVAQNYLVQTLQDRDIHRQYSAVVRGTIIAGGHVDAPIGRHPVARKRMAVVNNGKPALTHYRVQQRFQHFTHIKCILESGRTHQIRVHMAHIKHPLVGDPVYGGRSYIPRQCSPTLAATLQAFNHQALHAERLEFAHPISKQTLNFNAPMPPDMIDLLALLQREDVK